MSFIALSMVAICLMAGCCWASNVWPGHDTWARAAISRVLWWGGPIGLVVWSNGAPIENAMILGFAGWCGAWTPHVEFPQEGSDWQTISLETAVNLLRVATLLAPLAAVFWLCGADWTSMLLAVGSSASCMYGAVRLPPVGTGLSSNQEIYGVLFGAAVGFWLAVAVWSPMPAPDLLP